ncbi:RDD family protein [Aestuariispira insulae]|uniref:Putative RDD family membrane protein YckC n=1 Tax=Aestuariispira insulae TaxID=1461337 RepID=A0A3D9HVD6_9PROT|nr:RDD family protein [Aestuariispira insulae]RED53400.1 putative RDD family membrane protein YckC [Aestuariispira insulae]
MTLSPNDHKDAKWQASGVSMRTHQDADATAVTGRRMVAYLIDVCLLGLLVPLSWLLSIITFGLLSPIIALVLMAAPFIYHPVCIASSRGATIGQRIMGLRVISHDGDQVSPIQALFQTVLFYATLGFSGGLLLLWALFDDKSRCLHDIFSGTVTVREN